jgi:serine/threonine-protein kinase
MPPVRESLAVSGSSGQIPAGATVGGRFRIDGLLSQDSVSQTYRATDINHRNAAAVRVIPMRVLGASAAQLETDVENASALVHKNLVEVLTVGREADFFFLATELLDGQSLREFIDGKKSEGRTVSFRGACNLVTHIANGLERAASTMPHGGLNPATVWVNKAGRVKVADLGLARTLPTLARRGVPSGAPEHAYLAPELLAGGPPTLVSDVYALGVILFVVLTGRLPAPPLRVAGNGTDAPAGIDALIAKALARDPGARFHSAMELRQALANLQAGGSTGISAVGPAPTAPVARAPAERHAATFAAQAQRHPAAETQPAGQAQADVAWSQAQARAEAQQLQDAQAQAQAQAHAQQAAAAAAQAQAQAAQQQEAAAGSDGRRSTFGRSFNVAEVAGGAVDEAQERWLIQKDRLDFGPFSLAQIRAQIQRGEIIGEHMIVDSDTGTRSKVKDFAPLRDFARHSERQIEQNRRAHAEIKHEKSEKAKRAFTLVIVSIALLAIAGGGGWYVLTRKAADKTTLAERSEDAEIDAFLKDVKLSFQKASTVKHGGAHRGGGSVAGDGDFSNDANFGDASKHGSGGDELLDDQIIEETMMKHYRGLVPCLMQERHKNPGVNEMSVDFVVRGTGKVSAVKVNGQKSGSFANCVLGRMPTFPKYNGNKTIASWSMSMK